MRVVLTMHVAELCSIDWTHKLKMKNMNAPDCRRWSGKDMLDLDKRQMTCFENCVHSKEAAIRKFLHLHRSNITAIPRSHIAAVYVQL